MFCIKCGSKCEDFVEGENLRKNVLPADIFIIKTHTRVLQCLLSMMMDVYYWEKEATIQYIRENGVCPAGMWNITKPIWRRLSGEVQEEVGITVAPDGIINVISNHFPNGVHSLVVVLIAHYSGDGVLTPGDDIVEAGWFSVEDMDKLPSLAFSADVFILTKYKK